MNSNEPNTNNLCNEAEAHDLIEKNKIYNKDCLIYLKDMEPQTIDLIVLDPPYYQVVKEDWDNIWKSMDEYLLWIENVVKELERVSKYSCSVWLFGYAYQLGYIIPIFEKYGFTYRQHITINKGLRSVAGRTSAKLKMFPTVTEHIIYFHKEARPTIRDILQKRQKETKIKSSDINLQLGKAINGGGTWSCIAGKKQKTLQYPTKEDWNKLNEIFGGIDEKYDDLVYKFNIEQGITDVWDDINFYDKSIKRLHPTQKPYSLIERIIKCSTNEGDNVLDIFMGSCMTAYVCNKTNRNFYGCELEKKYFENNLITNI
jgi:DNA modification methylase